MVGGKQDVGRSMELGRESFLNQTQLQSQFLKSSERPLRFGEVVNLINSVVFERTVERFYIKSFRNVISYFILMSMPETQR